MEILSAIDYPAIPRRVVRVVENPDDPQWVHIAANGIRTPSPKGHTGDTEATGVVCRECRSNWRVQEFIFTGQELVVRENKWGNAAHDRQPRVSEHPKTWDEIYLEVDERVGEHVEFGGAVREAAPVFVSENEPEFELVIAGDPGMDGKIAHQRYKVLRHGEPKAVLTASGETHDEFQADLDKQYSEAQTMILDEEAQAGEAVAVIEG